MWKENRIFCEDMDFFASRRYIPWEALRNRSILISGATGLIGYTLVCALAYADVDKSLNLKIYALVRDMEKAKDKFSLLQKEYARLYFVVGDVSEVRFDEPVDYIVHAASPTASAYFVNSPVETVKTAVCGTLRLLDLAKEKQVKGFAYLSSMEVYGAPHTEELLKETDLGYMDPLSVRNCYPESKRLCEALCASYASEYQVPAKIIRLAQTFGPGVRQDDARVFADIARCALVRRDIQLRTDGSSKRSYLYTMDAATAIMTVLLKGSGGEAYNAANPATYCSVREMADLAAKHLCGGKISVKTSCGKDGAKLYPPKHFYHLSTEKLEELGWNSAYSLPDMYTRMIRATWSKT